jgi:hypothetical protein
MNRTLTCCFSLSLLLIACGDSPPASSCTRNSECSADQVCTGGQCVSSGGDAGTDLTDAGGDPVVDADAGLEVSQDLSSGDTPTEDTPTEEIPTGPPIVESTDPEDGETGVSLDSSVEITFDQAMRDTSLTASNVSIAPFSGDSLVRTIVYNPPTNSVTLSPLDADGHFEPSSPYTVTVAREVHGANNLNMLQDYEFTFITEPFSNADDHADLARAYAPVIYQEVRPGTTRNRTNRIDYFTSIDFDGDLVASNNLVNGADRGTSVSAHVYFSVLESDTHYFIEYVLYYPLGVNSPEDEFADSVEHDFAFMTVVVQKLTDDPLGRFVFAEGYGSGQVWGFRLDAYPSDCGAEEQPPCGGIDGVSLGDLDLTLSPDDLEADPDEEDGPGRRYPAYISPATHASCLFGDESPSGTRIENKCRHDTSESGPFDGETVVWSRVLRVGDEASEWVTGEVDSNEMTYTLSSFVDLFWAMRGVDDLYSGSRTYSPPDGGAGRPVSTPASLASSDEIEATQTRRQPFQVVTDVGRACDGCSRTGVWFIDPIWEMSGHYDFDHDFATDYCFNPYLGIDDCE